MPSKRLQYLGRVEQDGTIKLPKRFKAEVITMFRGKEFTLTVKPQMRTKTNPQLGYYFGVVLPYILQGFQDVGNNIPDTKEGIQLVHTLMKRRFLEPVCIADANGEIHEVEPSLEDASKQETGEYIDKCIAFAAEFLNVAIPAPGEQAEMNF
jgi:hypothetical protein